MSDDRVVVVSSDGHVSAPPEAFTEYIDKRYLPDLEALNQENEEFLRFGPLLSAFSPQDLEVIDEQGAIASGGVDGGYDLKRRLVEMDREGIAAELMIPANQCAVLPFFHIHNKPHPPELRAAGARAYHRWLADQVGQADGRLVATADSGPCRDMGEALAELHWVAEQGFAAIGVPGAIADAQLPAIYDDYYEPYWAACADLGLAFLVHSPGHEKAQGMMFETHAKLTDLAGSGDGFDPEKLMQAAMTLMGDSKTTPFTLDMSSQRLMWQLMLSGVFDRHPSLRLVFTEVRADWVPATLAHLDAIVDRGQVPMRRKPSEYWVTNCYCTPSSIRRSEIELRHEIGIDRLMFGRDYPHPEGTWPNTLDWIRATFDGVSEPEARAILGGNAIECFGLDGAALTDVAAGIGPRIDDLLGKHDVQTAKIDHFNQRSGYSKPVATFDAAAVQALLDEDLAGCKVN